LPRRRPGEERVRDRQHPRGEAHPEGRVPQRTRPRAAAAGQACRPSLQVRCAFGGGPGRGQVRRVLRRRACRWGRPCLDQPGRPQPADLLTAYKTLDETAVDTQVSTAAGLSEQQEWVQVTSKAAKPREGAVLSLGGDTRCAEDVGTTGGRSR